MARAPTIAMLAVLHLIFSGSQVYGAVAGNHTSAAYEGDSQGACDKGLCECPRYEDQKGESQCVAKEETALCDKAMKEGGLQAQIDACSQCKVVAAFKELKTVCAIRTRMTLIHETHFIKKYRNCLQWMKTWDEGDDKEKCKTLVGGEPEEACPKGEGDLKTCTQKVDQIKLKGSTVGELFDFHRAQEGILPALSMVELYKMRVAALEAGTEQATKWSETLESQLKKRPASVIMSRRDEFQQITDFQEACGTDKDKFCVELLKNVTNDACYGKAQATCEDNKKKILAVAEEMAGKKDPATTGETDGTSGGATKSDTLKKCIDNKGGCIIQMGSTDIKTLTNEDYGVMKAAPKADGCTVKQMTDKNGSWSESRISWQVLPGPCRTYWGSGMWTQSDSDEDEAPECPLQFGNDEGWQPTVSCFPIEEKDLVLKEGMITVEKDFGNKYMFKPATSEAKKRTARRSLMRFLRRVIRRTLASQ